MSNRLETYLQPFLNAFLTSIEKKDGSITRRQFILGGMIGSLAILAACDDNKGLQSSPYDHWEKYTGKEFPQDAIVAIGRNLGNNTEYPGFSDVGNLIVRSHLSTNELREYFPILTSRIPLQSADIHEPGLMQPASNDATIKELTVIDQTTGRSFQEPFVETKSLKLTVKIDSGIYLVPEKVRQLVVAKEFSHVLYLQQCADNIASQVESRYSIVRSSDTTSIPTFLFINSIRYGGQPNRHSLGDAFDNGNLDIDGAGYWHIMKAFGKMKTKGQLSSVDLSYLSSVNTAFEKATEMGLLIQTQQNSFQWKVNISPFSPEWTSITRSILTNKNILKERIVSLPSQPNGFRLRFYD